MEKRCYLLVKAKNIHPSSIIPSRNHDFALVQSVKSSGIQQPLIVRPVASKPGEYELMDGGGRHDALEPEQEVWVEVRQCSNSEAFRISNATSKSTRRNTRESAEFYAKYIDIVKEEIGDKGALARVAVETQLSESELSQYSAINKLFLELDKACEMRGEERFPKLETMGINKLYKLSELLNNPRLLEAAREVEKKADKITVEGICAIVANAQPDEYAREVEKMAKNLDLDNGSVSAASVDAVNDPLAETRFKELKEKIAAMAEEAKKRINEFLGSEKLSSTETTLVLLEKMSVCFRRVVYYAEQIQMQGDECQKG
jgi:hypothetical protein